MKKEISIGLCSVLATLIFLFPVQAQTDEKMGHPLINRSIHDTGSGGIFLFESSFTLENSTLINFSFYDDDFPGRQITPLIFESSSSDWKIVGVGTTRTTDGSGPQTYDFGLVSGSSATGPGKHFGWKHGDLTSRENGTPEFNSGAPGRFVWLGDPVAPIELNQELSPNVTLDRTYSIEAVASVQGSSPSAPSNVTGLAADASIQVSWTAPADNGGKTITSYTATASQECLQDFAGNYILEGSANQDVSLECMTISISQLENSKAQIHIRSKSGTDCPECTFKTMGSLVNDHKLTSVINGKTILFSFTANRLLISAANKEDHIALEGDCPGANILGKSFIKIESGN